MPGYLFQLPKPIAWDAGSAQAGAKLTFSATGTSNAQNTYTDAALSVAHANPVVADSEGLFAPIYLDPSLPDYRVTYTDSADVQIYQVDDVPSNAGAALDYTAESTAPFYLLTETDGSSNNKNWRWIATGEQLILQVGNDALDTWVSVLEVDRTANTVDLINLKPATLQLNGAPLYATGSFAGTLTGFSSNPTPTVQWRRSVNTVWLSINAGSTGTSNATSMTMTGVPSAIQPATSLTRISRLTDNGSAVVGVATIGTSGTITFGNGIGGGNFTASGTKGVGAGWSLVYDLQ